MNYPKAQPMFERQRDLEDRTDGPDVLSAIEASEKGAAPLVGTGDLVGLGYRGSDGAMTCFLCDCEMEWEDCSFCGGDGYFDGYEEDPNWYAPGEDVPCSQCGGSGGEWWCQTKDCKTMTCTRVVSKPNTSSQRTRHPMPDHQSTEAPTQEQRPGSL